MNNEMINTPFIEQLFLVKLQLIFNVNVKYCVSIFKHYLSGHY